MEVRAGNEARDLLEPRREPLARVADGKLVPSDTAGDPSEERSAPGGAPDDPPDVRPAPGDAAGDPAGSGPVQVVLDGFEDL